MSDLRKASEMALEALELHAEQYPHMVKGYTHDAAEALRQALAQPEQKIVDCVYPKCETAGGCNGPCSRPPYAAGCVDTVNILQECVDETAKREHEPVMYSGNGTAGRELDVRPTGFFVQMPKREWVGLTDDEIGWLWHNSSSNSHEYARAIESKLKEKNT